MGLTSNYHRFLNNYSDVTCLIKRSTRCGSVWSQHILFSSMPPCVIFLPYTVGCNCLALIGWTMPNNQVLAKKKNLRADHYTDLKSFF